MSLDLSVTAMCTECLVYTLWQLPFSLQTMTTTLLGLGAFSSCKKGTEMILGIVKRKVAVLKLSST